MRFFKNFYICRNEIVKIMSEQELNSYRLTSLEEPTDEMLAQIIYEAAVDARKSNEAAHKKFFEEFSKW